MASRSQRLAGPIAVLPAVPTLLYTCPAAANALVKLIVAVNEGGNGVTYDVGIGGLGVGQRLVRGRQVANASYDMGAIPDDRPVVLEPGDTLNVLVGGLFTVTFTVCGAEIPV